MHVSKVLMTQPTATAWTYIAITYIHQEQWDHVPCTPLLSGIIVDAQAKKALSMALGLADTSRLPTLSGELTSGHPMLHADCWGLMSLVRPLLSAVLTST